MSAKQRVIWIDWVKTIGMLMIIWGHCFPKYVSGFLYAFNVPLFFIISGYLCKKEKSLNLCLGKIFHNLIIPYFILGFIKVFATVIEHFSDGLWFWPILSLLGGFHHLNDLPGCGNLWFVYTLIIIRLLYHFFSEKRLLLSVISFAGALLYNIYDLEWAWAVVNILLALPYFMIGNYLAQSRQFNALADQVKETPGQYIFLLFVLLAVTIIIGALNGDAYLYLCHYGKHFLLFVVGSISGCGSVLLFSWMLGKIKSRIVYISSIGTIITLTFHIQILHYPKRLLEYLNLDVISQNVGLFLSAVFVLLSFVPVIILTKRYFPIILGSRAKGGHSTPR